MLISFFLFEAIFSIMKSQRWWWRQWWSYWPHLPASLRPSCRETQWTQSHRSRPRRTYWSNPDIFYHDDDNYDDDKDEDDDDDIKWGYDDHDHTEELNELNHTVDQILGDDYDDVEDNGDDNDEDDDDPAWSSSSVGFSPSFFMTLPSSAMLMLPLPSTSYSRNAFTSHMMMMMMIVRWDSFKVSNSCLIISTFLIV